MDGDTYEQFMISDEVAGAAAQWLEPEMHFQAELLNGQVVGLELPAAMEYTIVETAPVMRGDGASGSRRSARARLRG